MWAVGRRLGSIPDPQYPYRNVQNTIVQHWNGTTWSLVPSPNDSTTQNFIDVAAVSKDELWAVGENDMGVLIARFRRAPCIGTPTADLPTP